MPTYAFACPTCATSFEEKRSFARATEPANCPSCDGEGRRVFSAVPFYRPGEAAKALLNGGGAANTTTATDQGNHSVGCPCCGGR